MHLFTSHGAVRMLLAISLCYFSYWLYLEFSSLERYSTFYELVQYIGNSNNVSSLQGHCLKSDIGCCVHLVVLFSIASLASALLVHAEDLAQMVNMANRAVLVSSRTVFIFMIHMGCTVNCCAFKDYNVMN